MKKIIFSKFDKNLKIVVIICFRSPKSTLYITFHWNSSGRFLGYVSSCGHLKTETTVYFSKQNKVQLGINERQALSWVFPVTCIISIQPRIEFWMFHFDLIVASYTSLDVFACSDMWKKFQGHEYLIWICDSLVFEQWNRYIETVVYLWRMYCWYNLF